MGWFRKPAGDPLAVSMAGLKLGDRLLVVGASDIALIAALGGKVGLTGRACLVADTEPDRVRAAAAVEAQGVLLESFAAPPTALPFDEETFDVVILRSVLPNIPADGRTQSAREVRRVLRPGGRCIVMDNARPGGWTGLVGGRGGERDEAAGSATLPLLEEAGFRAVRRLAEREGLVFIEGVKAARSPAEHANG